MVGRIRSVAAANRNGFQSGISTLPFSPDTTRWRKTAVNDLRKLGIDR